MSPAAIAGWAMLAVLVVGAFLAALGSLNKTIYGAPSFVERVQVQVNGYLDQCVAQAVLQPAGCPFGIEIDDKVVSDPVWTMITYPTVTLTPGETAFEMPPTEGVAHISVEVQSLFDGEFSQLEEDRPFMLALTATIRPDGSIAIQLM